MEKKKNNVFCLHQLTSHLPNMSTLFKNIETSCTELPIDGLGSNSMLMS